MDLDAQAMTLADAKPRLQAGWLLLASVKLLTGLVRETGNPWIRPGHKPDTHRRDLDGAWEIVRARVRLTDLGHAYASRARALAESLRMIGKRLG